MNEANCNQTISSCIDIIVQNKESQLSQVMVLYKSAIKKANSTQIRETFSLITNSCNSLKSIPSELIECLVISMKNFNSYLKDDEFQAFRVFFNKAATMKPEQMDKFFANLEGYTQILFTQDNLLILLEDICKNQESSDTNLIIRIFKLVNEELFDSNDYVACPHFIKGATNVWNTIIRDSNRKLAIFLADCFIAQPSYLIDECKKYLDNPASLTAVIRLINCCEYTHDSEMLKIKRNAHPSFLYNSVITLEGEINTTINASMDIDYNAFLEKIAILINLSPSSFYISRENGSKIREDTFYLNSTDKLIVTRAPYSYEAFQMPNVSDFPSMQMYPFREALYKQLQDDTLLSQRSYLILSQIETLGSVTSDLKTGKWDEVLDINHKLDFLYKINEVGNLLYEDEEFSKSFIETGGAKLLFDVCINKLEKTYTNQNYQEIILDVMVHALSKTNDFKALLKGTSDDPITTIVDLIAPKINMSEKMRLNEHYLALLQYLSIPYPTVLESNKTFMDLFSTFAFHKRKVLRQTFYSILNNLDQNAIQDQMVSLLKDASDKFSMPYLQMLPNIIHKAIIQDKDNKQYIAQLYFDALKDIIMKKYSPEDSSNKMSVILFKNPPLPFTEQIFSLLTIIITEGNISDQKLFEYVVNTILFNNLRYNDPPTTVFNAISAMIDVNPKLLKLILPKFTQITIDDSQSYQTDSAQQLFGRKKGLVNQGCTCYMNSSLQQLFNVPEYRSFILKQRATSGWLRCLQRLFVDMSFSSDAYVDPRPFVKKWKWFGEPVNPSIQQDAVEFLQAIIDDVNNLIPDSNTVFKGTLNVETIGDTNKFRSERKEEFITLPLEVQGHKSLEDSFKTFLEPTILDGENQYSDEKLGKFDAKMYHTILDAPQVLILQLMRFSYNISTNQREKIDSKYTFPHELNLTEAMHDKSTVIYDLCGVIMHIGCAFGGHYYSYAGYGNEWYCFNDSHVKPFNPSKLPKVAQGGHSHESAYILFYRKRTDHPPPPIEMNEELFESLSADIEDNVRSQISNNKEYQRFITKLSSDRSNPSVTIACLSRQKTIDPQIKEIILESVKKDPYLVYNKATMKDLMIVCNTIEVREFISQIVTSIIQTTKDTSIYTDFLFDNIRASVKYFKNFDEFLQPLRVAVKIDVSCSDLLKIILEFVEELEIYSNSHPDIKILNEIRCGILFELIHETLTEESKPIIDSFIRKDTVRKLRRCTKETSLLRSLCMSQDTQNQLIESLKGNDPSETAEAFVSLASLGIFKDLEILPKRKQSFLINFLIELSKISSSSLSHFFATETWWIQTFLIQRNDEIRSMIVKVIHRAFPTAEPMSVDVPMPMSEEERPDLEDLSLNLIKYFQDMAKLQYDMTKDFEIRRTYLAYNYIELLKWAIIRAECPHVFKGQFLIFYNAIKIFKKIESDKTLVCDVLSLISNTIQPSCVHDFFGNSKNYIQMCNLIADSCARNNDSPRYIAHFLIRTEEKSLSKHFLETNLVDLAMRGLRDNSSWNDYLGTFIIKYMTDEGANKIIKIATNQDNKVLFIDSKCDQIATVIQNCIHRKPILADKVIDSYILPHILSRISKNIKGDLIILSTLLFAKMGSNLKLISSVNQVIPRLSPKWDSPVTWNFYESFLVSGKTLSEFAVNSIPKSFINDQYNDEKLSFIKTSFYIFKDNPDMLDLLLTKYEDSFERPVGKVIDGFCLVLSQFINENHPLIIINFLNAIKKANELAFGSGTKKFCQKAETLDFDISSCLQRCFDLIQSYGAYDEPPKLKRLLEFAFSFPMLKDEIKMLSITKIEFFRSSCAENTPESIDCLKLLDLILGQ